MLNKKALGQHIREARKKKKLTQQDLATMANMSRSYLADVERGRYAPSVETLQKIAIPLEIDLNFLKMTEMQVDESA